MQGRSKLNRFATSIYKWKFKTLWQYKFINFGDELEEALNRLFLTINQLYVPKYTGYLLLSCACVFDLAMSAGISKLSVFLTAASFALLPLCVVGLGHNSVTGLDSVILTSSVNSLWSIPEVSLKINNISYILKCSFSNHTPLTCSLYISRLLGYSLLWSIQDNWCD